MVKVKYTFPALCLAACLYGCDKVDPTGVLIGKSSVDDRVKQSQVYWDKEKKNLILTTDDDEYSFLVAADTHATTNLRRMKELFTDQVDPKQNNLFCTIIGDIAETQPEFYHKVDSLHDDFAANYPDKFVFYPTVGNHDVTRNGWALYNMIFGASTYISLIGVGEDDVYDMFIFLDSANGTLGKRQLEDVLPEYMEFRRNGIPELGLQKPRHCFVLTHQNFFRPRATSFASNFPREEQYYLLNTFTKYDIQTVFCGHIHKYDDRIFGGVRYTTLDALSERNSPQKGMVIKVTCKKDGTIQQEIKYYK